MKTFMNEAFDYKRFMLLNKKRCCLVIIGALFGLLLFGGTYYVKTTFFSGDSVYRSKVLFNITFATEDYDAIHLYYNDSTWNDVIDSDLIAGVVSEETGIPRDIIEKDTIAPMMSDMRMIWVYVDDTDRETAENIANGLVSAMKSFASKTEGFAEIEPWDGPTTEILAEDSYLLRTSVFGAVVGAVAGIFVLLYINAMDDSVYTLEDIGRRYGYTPAGAVFKDSQEFCDSELASHVLHSLQGSNIAICYAESFLQKCEDDFQTDIFADKVLGNKYKLTLVKNTGDDFCETLKKYDGYIMLVRYGRHNHAALSRAFESCALMDMKPSSVCLVDCDYKFYRQYYRSGKS